MNSRDVVLIVEDDDDDLFLLERQLAQTGAPLVVKHARDGRAAVQYLEGAGAFADRAQHPLTGIVFLDLKIPYMNGHEVLAWIRARPGLEHWTQACEERKSPKPDRCNRPCEIRVAAEVTRPSCASHRASAS